MIGRSYATNGTKRPVVRPDSLGNWYMFENQGLADVLDQLSIIYNVEIQYSSGDLHNKFFIGRLDKYDSLEDIINDIALLNHLSVAKREGCYVIRKRK